MWYPDKTAFGVIIEATNCVCVRIEKNGKLEHCIFAFKKLEKYLINVRKICGQEFKNVIQIMFIAFSFLPICYLMFN